MSRRRELVARALQKNFDTMRADTDDQSSTWQLLADAVLPIIDDEIRNALRRSHRMSDGCIFCCATVPVELRGPEHSGCLPPSRYP